MEDVLAIILGGGRGTRLFPLTLKRSKPAVPPIEEASTRPDIDIPIYQLLELEPAEHHRVLTQFELGGNLNKHIGMTYKFDHLLRRAS